MKKYIEADKIARLINNGWATSKVAQAIDDAQLMVSVDKMQKLITEYDVNGNSFYLIAELRKLINPKTKLYAGLTVEDWEKLNKLPYVLIELNDTMGNETEYFLDDFMRKGGEIEDIKELLPDQKNHVRAHISYDPPVPNNVLVETYYPGIAVGNDCKACYKNWGSSDHLGRKVTGYRIVGVGNE